MRERPEASTVAQMLADLSSDRDREAWAQFLTEHSELITSITRRYTAGVDDADDCYLMVCEKLSEGGYRRLRSFDVTGAASFTTWLRLVVANLCIDWARQQDGRVRPFANIGRLPELAQRVYRYRYEQHLTLQESLLEIRSEFPDSSEADVVAALRLVNATLTPHQRWLLSVRNGRRLTPVESDQVASPDRVDDVVAAQRQAERLNQAMAGLDARQRLMLRLRFEEDLTFREIAALMKLGDPFRARREIDAAVRELRQRMGDSGGS